MKSLIEKLATGAIFILIIFTSFAYSEVPNRVSPTLTVHPYEFVANSGKKNPSEKGELWVPENRSKPNSRQIKLEFVRFKSKSKNPGSPIVYLAGGPGGSGIQTARWRRFPLFLALTEVADVIALDQRGTGSSNSIPSCTGSMQYPLSEAIVFSKHLKLLQGAAQECAKFWQKEGVDIAGYNTWENAADLNDLRVALGEEKISLWGISYGSHLALTAMKQFPDHIEQAVLASLEGPDDTIKLPARTDAYFERVQLAINQDPSAKKAYPDLLSLIRRVHQKLAKSPVKVGFQNSNGKHVEFLLGSYELQTAVAGMIGDPQRISMLPAIYTAFDFGAISSLPPSLIQGIYNAIRADQFSLSGMSEAMDAASGISVKRETLIAQQAQTAALGNALNYPFHLLRDQLGVGDLGDDFRKPTISTIPTLFLSGTLDGRTYPESAAEIVTGFKNGTHIIIENAGHNLFMLSPEIQTQVVNFMKGEKISTEKIVLPIPKFMVFE